MTLEFRIRLGNELVNIRGIGSSWLYKEIKDVARQIDGFNESSFNSDISRMIATGILSKVAKFPDDPLQNRFRYVVENPMFFPKIVEIKNF